MSSEHNTKEFAAANVLFEQCARFLDIFRDHPAKFTADCKQVNLAHEIEVELEKTATQLVPSENWRGDSSCGLGNWSRTPWAAVYDVRETDKASDGVYPVIHFLFDKEDGAPTDSPGVRVAIGVSVKRFTGPKRSVRVEEVGKELLSIVGNASAFENNRLFICG